MVIRQLAFLSSWIYVIQCSSFDFHKVQFIPPATSYTSRTDRFSSGVKLPKPTKSSGINRFFTSDFPTAKHSELDQWPSKKEFYRFNSFRSGEYYDSESHSTPDFSDGLSYPDPFLRTGLEAKKRASYLYSKELFFHNIPHEKALLYNQEQRRNNGLPFHILGSLRDESPWYRFKHTKGFGGHGLFNF